MSIDEIASALRERAEHHRENGWELMREGDPSLLELAADTLLKWKAIADARAEQARINHEAYRSLHNDTLGPL